MLTYVTGNLLDDSADALVNPVNCVGVMGAGLAKQFAERWPVQLDPYRELCRTGRLRVGGNAVVNVGDGKRVILFPTKQHWKDRSNVADIADGLRNLAAMLLVFRPLIDSVALPAVGCGLGGLKWADVQPLIEWHFAEHPTEVRVYRDGRDTR